jgi:hypothetical protein
MKYPFDELNFWSVLLAIEFLLILGGAVYIWVFLIKLLRKSRSRNSGLAPNEHFDPKLEEMKQRIAALEEQVKQMQSRPA